LDQPTSVSSPPLEGRGSADSHAVRYRAYIDGLRAIAVLSVVAFHFSKTALPGGYLGVDVFFVLSGYLITGIIWREARDDAFTYARFYERRIRRIAPALLTMLAATTTVGAVILLPQDLSGYAKSVVATIGFVANVYFWRDSDYFSSAAEEKPLLHMWSLGVEEQFYILFPIVLIFLARRTERLALLVVIALCIGSFIGNMLLVRIGGATPAFYLIPTRAWELGAGSIVAMWPIGRRPPAMLAHLIALASAVALVAALFFYPPLLLGTLPDATIAVAATAMLLWTGDTPGPVHRLLALRPATMVGLISYSLYVWHWPVIVLAQYWLVRHLAPAEVAAALLLMFALAYGSWRFIEGPFRSKTMTVRRLYKGIGAATAVLLLALAAIIAGQGWPQRLPAEVAQINAIVGSHYRCPIADTLWSGSARGCRMNLPSGDPKDADVAIIGNSHALMYAPMLADLLRERHLQGVLLHANRCLPSAVINVSAECAAQARDYIDAVSRLPRIGKVFIAFNWDSGETRFVDPSGDPVTLPREQALIAAVDDTIARLRQAGKEPVVVGPIAVPGWDVASVLGRKVAFGHPITERLYLPQAEFDHTMGSVIAAFAARRDLAVVRPDLVQCQAGRCDYVRGGLPLFGDVNHLSRSQLPRFAPTFARALDATTASPQRNLAPETKGR
jgi:peptidoglycan/LPS O-acetylase OafA/YrhL